MNISNLSINTAQNINNYQTAFKGKKKITNPTEDTFVASKKEEQNIEPSTLDEAMKNFIDFAYKIGGSQGAQKAAALIMTLCISAGIATGCSSSVDTAVGIDHYIAETATTEGIQSDLQQYEAPQSVIFIANNVNTIQELKDKSKVIIPERYDYMTEKIAYREAELQKGNLSKKEEEKHTVALTNLLAAQELQAETADVYADKHTIYYQLKKDINVEDFKDIFWIVEGVIAKNNNIQGRYFTEKNSMNDSYSYIDYSYATLEEGTVIRIPRAKGLRK